MVVTHWPLTNEAVGFTALELLQMGSFTLKVRRSMLGHTAAPVMHAPVAAAPAPVAAAPAAAAAAPLSSIEETVDESLVMVAAPKVRQAH